MKYHKKMLDVVFYARGGQGGKSAAEIVAQAAFSEGKYVQAFPQFGPERSGAPTKTFIRVSNEPIRTHEPVTDPDVVVVLDETIIESEKVAENLDQNEFLIVNSRDSAQKIKEHTGYNGKIFPIDANGISMEIIGQARPNTVILGKLVQVTEIASLEGVIREFRDLFEKKIGKESTNKNVAAIEKAYDTI